MAMIDIDSDISDMLATFTISGTIAHSVMPDDQHRPATVDCDILSVLAVAKQLQIDILHIIWQPALDVLGRGGTAEIRQSLVDVQTSLAFKRILPYRHIFSAGGRARCLSTIIAEMQILGHPSIRTHPNIVELAGICWDVSLGGGEVWPVLVFKRATYGDLGKFMTSKIGIELSVKQRFYICIEIGLAIEHMHSQDIIHGDLKPENILVSEDDQTDYRASVSDFGYSTWRANDDDMFYMPGTQPWVAPEWHHRFKTNSDGAKRMDVYSFGLLSLWLLFYNSSEALERVIEDDINSHVRGRDVVSEILTTTPRLTTHQKEILGRFYNLALAIKPAQRCPDIGNLISLLYQCSDGLREHPRYSEHQDGIPIPGKMPSTYSEEIDISAMMYHMYSAHYAVRDQVFSCLKARTDVDFPTPSRNIVIQLAFCYAIGLGVSRNEQQAFEVLQQNGLPKSVLSNLIELGRKWSVPSFQTKFFKNLEDKGVAPGPDNEYGSLNQNLDSKPSKDIQERYRRELADIKSSLGPRSMVSQLLQLKLASILGQQGMLNEVEEIQARVLKIRRRTLGENNHSTLDVMSDLALTMRKLGKYADSEKIGKQVLKATMRSLGPKHPNTLSCLQRLAQSMQGQGKYTNALKLHKQVFNGYLKLVGKERLQTLAAMSNLAIAYSVVGKLTKVERLEMEVLDISRKIFGADHPETLISMSNLAKLLMHLGKLEEAEELGLNTLKARQKVLGNEHPDTLLSMANLAVVYHEQERWSEAEELELQALECTRKIFGENHPDTLTCKTNLAASLSGQERLDEALQLQLQVFATAQQIWGTEHIEMLHVMQSLSETYCDKDQYKDAEVFQISALKIIRRTYGAKNQRYFHVLGRLAYNYLEQSRLQEAEKLYVEVSRGRMKYLGVGHKKTLEGMAFLSKVFILLEDWEKAEQVLTRCMQNIESNLDASHDDFFKYQLDDIEHCLYLVLDLTEHYEEQKWHEEADAMYFALLDISRKRFGETNIDTIILTERVGMRLLLRGDFDRAEKYAEEALLLLQQVCGATDAQIEEETTDLEELLASIRSAREIDVDMEISE